jgi:hypothetical protein
MKRILPFAIVAILAACAVTTAESEPNGPPATIDVPEASTPDAVVTDAGNGLDAACDPADPNCVTKPISCAEAAWCPVATGVSSLFVLTNVWGKSANDVWASGSGGSLVHWDGSAWTAGNLPVKNTFHNLLGVGNEVWALSATDTMYRTSTFAGAATQWTLVSSPFEDAYSIAPITAAWASPIGELRIGMPQFYMQDSEGNFSPANQFTRTTIDGGLGWKGWPGTATINAIWGTAADDLWIAADNSSNVSWQLGVTMHGRAAPDGGAGALEWQPVDSQASVVFFSIWGTGANDIWAVGDKGTIRHIGSANADRWDIVASPTKESLRSVYGFGANDVWAVGENGTILHFDGKEWKESVAAFQVNRKKPDLHGVWGSGPNDVWIVGDGVALHHTGGAK